MAKITWTQTDEAPALATIALLPILKSFTKGTDIKIELADISLAGRIIANFHENLKEDQKIPDFLTKLGEMTQEPDSIIVKLPNISASLPQLQEAIKELKEQGYDIYDLGDNPGQFSNSYDRNNVPDASAFYDMEKIEIFNSK